MERIFVGRKCNVSILLDQQSSLYRQVGDLSIQEELVRDGKQYREEAILDHTFKQKKVIFKIQFIL